MTDRLDEAKRLHHNYSPCPKHPEYFGAEFRTPIDERACTCHKETVDRLRVDIAEALSLLRCAQSNWAPGCCHQPEWDERRAALLAKHKETK